MISTYFPLYSLRLLLYNLAGALVLMNISFIVDDILDLSNRQSMITLLISALRTQINEMKVMVISYWFISSWLAAWLEGVLGEMKRERFMMLAASDGDQTRLPERSREKLRWELVIVDLRNCGAK